MAFKSPGNRGGAEPSVKLKTTVLTLIKKLEISVESSEVVMIMN